MNKQLLVGILFWALVFSAVGWGVRGCVRKTTADSAARGVMAPENKGIAPDDSVTGALARPRKLIVGLLAIKHGMPEAAAQSLAESFLKKYDVFFAMETGQLPDPNPDAPIAGFVKEASAAQGVDERTVAAFLFDVALHHEAGRERRR